MNIIVLDFESFFSDDYTLKKMTTEAYVRDPRFEAHGVAIRNPEWESVGPATTWFDGADIAAGALEFDWSNSAVLCHHAQFDGLILSHRFGIRPAYWLDTLSMARQQLGNHLSASLDNVRQHYGMPFKRTPYDKFKGKHWHEMSPDVQREVADGACDEVESIWRIFNLMNAGGFPPEMYPWIDNTVRMFTEPRLVGDIDMLGKLWQEETQHKAALLAQLGVTAKDLGSDEIFAGLLRQLGVEPDTKDTGKQIKYSFAKTDPMMQELADDEDDDVRALVEARLSIKSTLQQTRSERLGFMASRGPMCVYLSAFGAHTNRDAGGDKVNWQNFTRGSTLRKAVKPPKGYLTAKVDKSQIECRVLNMFAGQDDVIEKFRNKEDPYVGIASQFYGRTITRADEKERGTGKQLELSCGYGASSPTIIATARKGTYGPAVFLTDAEGERAKNLYRTTHQAVTDLWREAGRMISALAGTDRPVAWGCVEVHSGFILGPNGTRLRYPELAYEDDPADTFGGAWRYKTRKGRVKLYGAKLVENLIQWLAWIAFAQDICRIGKESGLWPSIREHDAGTWLIPDDQYAEQTVAWLKAEMSRPPAWMPDIPLDADAALSVCE
jgi:hypothetical protein